MTTAVQHIQNSANVVVQSGVTATAIAFFGDSMVKMVPYLIVAIPLIVLDLDWGIKAAKHRYAKTNNRVDRPRFSRAIRGTLGKMVEYVCWCVLASTASLAFGIRWIEWGMLGIVYFNEIASIIGNYLECKGIEMSIVDLWKVIIKAFSKKIGTEINPDEFIKGKDNDGKE